MTSQFRSMEYTRSRCLPHREENTASIRRRPTFNCIQAAETRSQCCSLPVHSRRKKRSVYRRICDTINQSQNQDSVVRSVTKTYIHSAMMRLMLKLKKEEEEVEKKKLKKLKKKVPTLSLASATPISRDL